MEKQRNERFLPGMGYESRWTEEGNGGVLSFYELQDRISSDSSGHVYLMEGPTGCGKSLMIRRLHERMPDRTVIFSPDRIADYCELKYFPREPNRYAGDTPEDYDLICIEDVDFLHIDYEQTELSMLIRELSEKGKTVVLNGIACTERVPELVQNLHPLLHVFRFADERNSD